jgi:hypothetical protein
MSQKHECLNCGAPTTLVAKMGDRANRNHFFVPVCPDCNKSTSRLQAAAERAITMAAAVIREMEIAAKIDSDGVR